MSTQAELLAPFIQRRERNLAHFKEHYPDIYEFFKDYKLKSLQLNILPDLGEVNLLSQGQHLYPQGAKQFAQEEVVLFKRAYSEGKQICSVYPSYEGDYKPKRQHNMAMDAMLTASPLKRGDFRFYKLGSFYPFLVFWGCGLAYHIEQLVLNDNVQNALIVEHDTDKFAASLYSVDWSEICARFDTQAGRKIHFLLGSTNDEYLLYAATWNYLTLQCPHFPVTVLYYNHQGRDMFDRVSDKINKDLPVYLTTWGDYDDEIRQLNYAVHNIHQGVKQLPLPFKQGSNTPFIIVGSGPSLDQRIELIRQIRDHAIVVSCGSSLKTLAHYDIKPDIHFELESDLYAYFYVSTAAPEDYYKDVKLIGPSHISPLIYELFDDGRMYYKQESATSLFFGDQGGNIMEETTPTCTNLALTFAIKMGFKQIFLFGTDCGFKDSAHHHAQGSPYYNSKTAYKAPKKDLIQITAVDGEVAWSTPIYFTSKRRMENVIKAHAEDPNLQVFNCSDMAEIEGTKWLNHEQFLAYTGDLKGQKEQDMDTLFHPDAKPYSLDQAKQSVSEIIPELELLARELRDRIGDAPDSLEAFSCLLTRLNDYLEKQIKTSMPKTSHLIQGSLKHFFYNGMAHAFALFDEQEQMAFIKTWPDHLLAFFDALPEHYRSVIMKDYDLDTDLWIKQSIQNPEDGMHKFFRRKMEAEAAAKAKGEELVDSNWWAYSKAITK